jgi:hypothetical protein
LRENQKQRVYQNLHRQKRTVYKICRNWSVQR